MKDKLRSKKPWPTKKAMEQVYEMNLWGGKGHTFYSGEGSHNNEIIASYKKVIISFLKSFKSPLVVCDLGCGDFNIGQNFVPYTKEYKAIDIVESLINYNKEKFIRENLEFYNLDLVEDKIPVGDCAIIRQVLQHLSNNEVQNILEKLKAFKYIILTEHIPNETFISNKDIISGQGIRLKKKSGLDILVAPFNFKVKQEKELNTIILKENKGIIKTILYTVF